MEEKEYEQLLRKYKAKVQKEFGEDAVKVPTQVSSKEYTQFKEIGRASCRERV